MPKSKKFSSNSEGPITISLGGTGNTVRLEPGDDYETEDPREIEALEANPDVSETRTRTTAAKRTGGKKDE